MASFFQVVKNWFRERKANAQKAIADPVREGKYAILDSKALIGKFRTEIAQFLASNKGVARSLENAKSDVDKWSRIVESAKSRGDADDVATAEAELSGAKRRAVEFKRQHDANEAAILNLKNQLKDAENKIAQAEGKHTALAARQNGVQIRKALAETSQRFGESGSPLAALDAFEDEVEAQEFEVEAMEELSVSGSESLATKYMASSGTVDADYDAMFGKK